MADRAPDMAEVFLRLPDLIGVVDGDGRLELLNPAWTKVLGWEHDELRGMSLRELIHPEDVDRTVEAMRALHDAAGTAGLENRIRCRNASYRWLQWTATSTGTSTYVVARDVTEAKLTEVALRDSQRFLESVVDNIPNMVFVKDAEALRFVRINQAGEDLLGYTQDDLLEKNDFDFFPTDEASFFVRKDREVLMSGEVLDIPSEPIETRFRGQRILHTKKIPILNEDGSPAYLLGIAEDITARVEGEELLRQRQDTLAALATANEAQARLTEALEVQRHIATTLQRSLLPTEVPAIAGLDVAARYWPSTVDLDVGGDFYDLFPIGDHRWGVLIGDVCGKGVAAAALTATARHSARAAATHVADPSDVLAWVHDAVTAQVNDRFVTIAFATLDMVDGAGTLTLALGGHPHPILARADSETEQLGRFGTVVGVIRTPRFHTTTTELGAGDLVAFYTDGLTDAPSSRALTETELTQLLASHRDEPLDDVAEAVHRAVLARCGGKLDDDAALLLFRIGNRT